MVCPWDTPLSVCVSTGPVEECRVLEVGSSGFSYASCLQPLPFICHYSKGTTSVIRALLQTPGGPGWAGGQGWGGPCSKGVTCKILWGWHFAPAACTVTGFGSPQLGWAGVAHPAWLLGAGLPVPPSPGIPRLLGQGSMGRGRKGV